MADFKSQKEVADLLGVSATAVNKWEIGESLPRVDRLIAISKLYGCSVEELLADREVQNETRNRDAIQNIRRISNTGYE